MDYSGDFRGAGICFVSRVIDINSLHTFESCFPHVLSKLPYLTTNYDKGVRDNPCEI